MVSLPERRWLTIAVVIGLLANVGVLGVAAATGQSQSEADVTQIGHQEITVTDIHITLNGAHIGGSGLPTIHIEDRTYTIQDAMLHADGITITYNGQTYEICSVTIIIDDVSVTLEDIHIGGE